MRQNRFSALIVDDEPLGRRILRTLLSEDSEIRIAAECSNGKEALSHLNREPVDLLFLDVQMPEMGGFQVLEQLESARLPVVVFVSGFDHYAVKAFEVNAFDYLLKPVDPVRFLTVVARAKQQIFRSTETRLESKFARLLSAIEESPGSREAPLFLKRLLVRTKSGILILPVDEVDYFMAFDYYSNAFREGKGHLLRKPLKDLEIELDPSKFARIHRSAIVNVERIRELRLDASGHLVILRDGTTLPISSKRLETLQARLLMG